jgi:hypothetical protein
MIEFIDMHHSVAKGAGCGIVDFSDNDLGAFHCLAFHGHTQAETAIPRLIGRANLDKGHIDIHGAGSEKPRDSGKATGNKVDPAFLNGRIGYPSGKECFQAVFFRKPLIDGDGIAKTNQLDYFQILKIRLRRGHKMFYQGPWLGHARSEKDAHPGLDFLQNFIRTYKSAFPGWFVCFG